MCFTAQPQQREALRELHEPLGRKEARFDLDRFRRRRKVGGPLVRRAAQEPEGKAEPQGAQRPPDRKQHGRQCPKRRS